jgi:hypothetical protein
MQKESGLHIHGRKHEMDQEYKYVSMTDASTSVSSNTSLLILYLKLWQ